MQKTKMAQLRWFISDAYCAERNCGCSRNDIEADRGACWDYADRIINAMPVEVAFLCGDHAQGQPVAWRWRWGDADFWKFTDGKQGNPMPPDGAPQIEPLGVLAENARTKDEP